MICHGARQTERAASSMSSTGFRRAFDSPAERSREDGGYLAARSGLLGWRDPWRFDLAVLGIGVPGQQPARNPSCN